MNLIDTQSKMGLFFSFEEIYDKIYIINLKHRTDRWNKVI